MTTYPHMCRDGHVEIGHADNSSEICPMCRVIVALETVEALLCDKPLCGHFTAEEIRGVIDSALGKVR